MNKFLIWRAIVCMALVFAPSIFVAATGDLSRQLDPTSVVDYGLVVAALLLPALGGLIMLRAGRVRGNIPSQLREAINVIRALQN